MSQTIFKYFNFFSSIIDKVFWLKSKGLSEQIITIHVPSDNNFTPKLTYVRNSKMAVKFEANCLKQDKIPFNHRNVVNGFTI